MRLNQSGFSMFSMMLMLSLSTAVVVLGNSLSNRLLGYSRRTDLIREVDKITEKVRAIVNNRDLCDRAFRNGGVTVAYNPAANDPGALVGGRWSDEVAFTRINLQGPGEPVSVMYTTAAPQNVILLDGNGVDSGLRLNELRYRRRSTGTNPWNAAPPPAPPPSGIRGVMNVLNITDPNTGVTSQYRVHDGEVVLRIGVANAAENTILGGGFTERVIPVTTLINSATNRIEMCSQPGSAKSICHLMGGIIDPTTQNCKTPYEDTNCQNPPPAALAYGATVTNADAQWVNVNCDNPSTEGYFLITVGCCGIDRIYHGPNVWQLVGFNTATNLPVCECRKVQGCFDVTRYDAGMNPKACNGDCCPTLPCEPGTGIGKCANTTPAP